MCARVYTYVCVCVCGCSLLSLGVVWLIASTEDMRVMRIIKRGTFKIMSRSQPWQKDRRYLGRSRLALCGSWGLCCNQIYPWDQISWDHIHVGYMYTLLARCDSSTHALRILRSHGPGSHKLDEVARMTSVAIGLLLYAYSSCWGFTSAQDRRGLES